MTHSYALTITTYYDLVQSKDSPFTYSDIMEMLLFLKERVLFYASSRKDKEAYYLTAFSMLYRALHNVLGGRGVFSEESVWLLPSVSWKSHDATEKLILAKAPSMAPFKIRYRIFQSALLNDLHRGSYESLRISVRRDFILQDAMKALDNSEKVKTLKRVTFISEFGIAEAGIDGGGLFKEFFIELCKIVFDPKYGLFKETSNRELYPNPSSAVTFGPDHLAAYSFIGKILSKAIYESILVEPQLADFFLRKMLGKPIDYKDLESLDAELYKHLISLRDLKDNVEDLALTFTTSDECNVRCWRKCRTW